MKSEFLVWERIRYTKTNQKWLVSKKYEMSRYVERSNTLRLILFDFCWGKSFRYGWRTYGHINLNFDFYWIVFVGNISSISKWHNI